MTYIDFMSSIHKSTKRDYLARVNDAEYPKARAAELAKKWDFDYWDGDRRVCYGGYRYIEGRWAQVAAALINHYQLKSGSTILDVGCGKGFLLYEMLTIEPGLKISGIDISNYAIENSKPEIRQYLQIANATHLPFPDKSFDLVISLTTLHNLHNYDLVQALTELERVGRQKYICVESYRNEVEKANLLYWQVTCEAFCTPDEWDWWFKHTNYSGDHSFIFFE